MSKKIHAIYGTYLALYLAGLAIPKLLGPVEDFGMLTIAVLPAILIARRGLLRNRFWQAMAGAHLVWGAAQILWIASQHLDTRLAAAQDSAYWLFKLLILGAIVYRPFYADNRTNRRLYHIDTAVALSSVAYYVGYFFISPQLAGQHITGTFYSSNANVLLNTGIAATAIVFAWDARRSAWGRTYGLIATGLTLYTIASLNYLLLGLPYTDPLWCATFWALALAVDAAPALESPQIEKRLVASRYGGAMMVLVAVFIIYLVTSFAGNVTAELRDVRIILTFCEVVVLATLLHFRHRAVVNESELRRSQLATTLNSLRQPIYIVDGDYQLVLANDVFKNKFQTQTGACYAVVFGRSKPCEWCELRNNRVFSATVEIQDSAYKLEFAPMPPDTDVQTGGGVEMLIDMTADRKRQRQLIQTERMAALGRMIAGTAHELNNPLAIILGNAQLLRDYTPLPPDGKRQVAAIATAAERARDIVHTFLTLSRPNESEKSLVDVGDVIRSVEHLKTAELESYGIAITLDLPASLAVMGRYTLLQEVMLNLLDNSRDAIRHAGRSDGLIRISGHVVRADSIRIDVLDNGAGILRENLDRIFDPFFSTKDVGQGTGLGLSIVHSIVHDHGGRIQVASDGASFTRFEIELPRVVLSGDVTSSPTGASVLRILAVDDDPEILSVLETSLSRMGHHVECTTTGSRALQLLSKNKFDILLLDMQLPEMDGRNIITRLNAMIPPISVRTIVLSGEVLTDDVREFTREHSLRMVIKPIDIGKLNELLKEPAAAGSWKPNQGELWR